MATSLLDRIQNIEDSTTYFDEGFQQFILLHLSFLKKQDNKQIPISEQDNHRFRGNLTGFLSQAGVDKKYHFMICQVNGVLNPQTYEGHLSFLAVPNFQVFERLHMLYMTEKN